MTANDSAKIFRERLSVALSQRRLSQSAFARLAGLSPSYVSEVLHGRRPPSEFFIGATEKALGGPLGTSIGDDCGVDVVGPAREIEESLASIVCEVRRLQAHLGRAHHGELFDLLAEVMRTSPENEPRIRGYLEALLQTTGKGGR